MWGDVPPPTWNKVVQGCVSRLRKVLGVAAIETSPAGYRLDDPARRHRRPPLRADGPTQLGAAHPRRARPRRLRERRGAGAVARAGAARARGLGSRPDRGGAARRAAPGCRGDPPRRRACGPAGTGRCWPRPRPGSPRRRCGSAAGRCWRWPSTRPAGRATRLRTLHRARTVLGRRVGHRARPGPGRVGAGDPAPGPLARRRRRRCPSRAPSARTWGWCPTTSTTPTASSGATARSRPACDRLAAVGVLAVVGPSGSGKSSLVRAGVAAALQRNGRRVVVITPGAHPMDALTALPASGPVPVLVVDQCEEAVTLCDDPAEQAAFFAAARRPRRTRPAGHRPPRRPPRRRLRPPRLRPPRRARIAPVERDERSRPASRDRGSGPSGRPAAGAWSGRPAGPRGRRRAGRAAAAVARVAPDLATARGPHPHRRRLPGTPAGSEDRSPSRPRRSTTRSPTSSGHCSATCCCAWSRRPPKASRFAAASRGAPWPPTPNTNSSSSCSSRARLVTSDDDTVELAHESLARAWPRLRGWLDDDVEGQRILRHLAGAADTWDTMGRPDSELYRGVRLAQHARLAGPCRPRPHTD